MIRSGRDEIQPRHCSLLLRHTCFSKDYQSNEKNDVGVNFAERDSDKRVRVSTEAKFPSVKTSSMSI